MSTTNHLICNCEAWSFGQEYGLSHSYLNDLTISACPESCVRNLVNRHPQRERERELGLVRLGEVSKTTSVQSLLDLWTKQKYWKQITKQRMGMKY